jgi:putative CocE/NonD family hydrolase
MRPHIPNKRDKQFDESTDTYDTIAWLLQHVPANNGRVGQWGISYPGFYTSAGAIDSHPALKAVSPQAPIADWFWDDMHHHGAFILPLAFNFFSSFGVAREEPTTKRPDRFEHGTADGYEFFLELGPLSNVNERHFKGDIAFWNAIVAHPNYDEFWQSRNLLPHLNNIRAAVLVVGGWFDTEDLYGPLKTYAAIERNNPKTFNALVMGPWSHGQWNRDDADSLGSVHWGFATSDYFRNEIQLPFFLHSLKDADEPGIAEATMFETGAKRWRRFDSWPPAGLEQRSLYLRERGGLAADPAATTTDAYDEYISDPAKPVPYTMEITTRWAKNYVTEDQRFAAWRPDVLVYRTEPLADDLTLAGPLVADLWVSTTGTASDWVVKLIDVHPGELPGISDEKAEKKEIEQYPGGLQMLVRAEVLRGRFRESYESPKPFTPGEITAIEFELQDVLHTFKRGHRVMIQIQSTWFPFVDRNPHTYVPNIFEAKESDFVKATNRVHRSQQHPSRVRVGVLR